jgi:septum site-determining protein MinC
VELEILMSDPVARRNSIRLCGRSYIAFVLMPEPPLFEWLAKLDEWTSQFAGYFIGKPVVLDVSAIVLSNNAILHLIGELQTRNIRIMGLEGVEHSELVPDLPPVLKDGRDVTFAKQPEAQPRDESQPSQKKPASLLLESPVRSGQSIVFPAGDVTVLGSVASGAEIIAGGSIHVYGALRGRAFAGLAGNSRARIFCNKVEAELLAIDGHYRMADDIESNLQSQPIQAWLKDDVIFITPLN